MSSPLITVLMTVYNGGEYLKTAVESILAQTFHDFEFLIINDCSKDGSAAVIQSYHDERIRLHNNEVNLGQTCSLNKGLSLARGKYIARIDADDMAFPAWLKTQRDYIAGHPQCVVVSCKGAVMNGVGEIKKILNTPLSYEEMILKSLTASPLNHVGSLYDKDAIIAAGGYDENFKIAADYELWSKLVRQGRLLASTSDVLVAIRVHEKSISIMERGGTDLKEISEVMARNFQAMTTTILEKEDVVLIWKLIYAVEYLSDQEFSRGQDLLTRAYASFHPELPLDPKSVQDFWRRQRRVIGVKRIFLKWAGQPLLKIFPAFYEAVNRRLTQKRMKHPILR